MHVRLFDVYKNKSDEEKSGHAGYLSAALIFNKETGCCDYIVVASTCELSTDMRAQLPAASPWKVLYFDFIREMTCQERHTYRWRLIPRHPS